MGKNLRMWQFAGFVFTALVGTSLHFLYDWSNKSVIAALFSGVNESIWEHMKLLYFPMFVFAIIEGYYISKTHKNFWCAKLVGIAVGLILIPTIYYTYTGALGVFWDWFNITIFFIANAVSYSLETCIIRQKKISCIYSNAAFLGVCLIGVMFIIFTFVQPKIPLFIDPVTGGYGIY